MHASVTSDRVLRGFAGQVATSSRSTLCTVKIMEAEAQVNAIIIPDSYLIHDIIVGRDFLEKQKHIITIKQESQLTFKQLPAMRTEDENAGGVNSSDGNSDAVFAINIDATNEDARQQCTTLFREFRDCISFSIKDLGKTSAAVLNIRCTEPLKNR